MIDIQNTSKSFNGTFALKNLNLKINAGEIVGLLGANGAGKSTTINILLGFLAHDSGQVQINGLDVGTNVTATRKLIGYIPVNFFENKINNTSKTDYFAYQNYRDDIQVLIDKKIISLLVDAWNEEKMDKNKYFQSVEKFKLK